MRGADAGGKWKGAFIELCGLKVSQRRQTFDIAATL